MIFPDFVIRQLEKVLDRRVFYRDYYLQSRHWKRFRASVKKRRGNACERCYRKPSPGALIIIDVHHLNYDHLWHETFDDVILLCRDCHKKEHGH